MPKCPGWVKLSREQISQLSDSGPYDCWSKHFDGDVMGIIIQYFPNSVQLSDSNITFELAERVMHALTAIHGSYVVHNDIDEGYWTVFRNCLITEQDKVIWIDFDQSRVPRPPIAPTDGGAARRLDFWIEIATCWWKLHNAMASPSLSHGLYTVSQFQYLLQLRERYISIHGSQPMILSKIK